MIQFFKTIIGFNIALNVIYMLIFAVSAIVLENINMVLFASLFALIQFCGNLWLGFYAFFRRIG